MQGLGAGQAPSPGSASDAANRRLQLVYGRQEDEIAAPIRSVREARQSAFPAAAGARLNRFTQNSKALSGGGSTPGHGMVGGGLLGTEGLGGTLGRDTLGNGLALVQLTLHPSFVLRSAADAPAKEHAPADADAQVPARSTHFQLNACTPNGVRTRPPPDVMFRVL